MRNALVALGLLLTASTASAEMTTTATPVDVEKDLFSCETLAEALAGVATKETVAEIQAVCPDLSTDYILVHVFGYRP